MVKKGIKRKTRWRTLSIGDGATDIDTGTTELKQDQSECLTTTSNTNLSSTYSKKPSSFTTPFHPRNGDRNHYFRTSDKYPSQSYNRSQSQDETVHQQPPTSYSYKRRPFYQSTSSRYYGNPNKPSPTSINRSYRSTDTFDNKENNATKPLFNEDEYTRITTPRQDVLFKKGYLSRPKKTITPIDSASSTAVSVVSTEGSISSSTQSTSPEHCSSTPELFDQDHPFMYPGFYDQNGVFFVNPFMTNGFDPYNNGGQMIMMPYGGSPYSINPTEYCNSELTPPYPPSHYQKRNSIDSENSPESPSSQNESTSASSTPAIDESSNEPSQNGDVPAESQSESDVPKPDEEMIPNECNHNMAMQYYYPYMYGPPPFMPINETYYNDSMAQYVNAYGAKYNRFRKRKRRPFKCGNSAGVSATTSDYSEDEDSIEENNRLLDHALQQNGIDLMPCLTMSQCDDVISRTTLNTNVSEFVPKHLQSTPLRTTLNVEVEEFHPRKAASSAASTSTDDSAIVDSSSKEPTPKLIAALPDAPKSTILQQPPNDKYSKIINPIKTSTDKPEQNNIQVSSAINKSSTLISSISTRDKNDDNVNGVDKNKKIEKLVDQVNLKADLDDKVVMHPKQNENILENVRKTKLKNMKTGKSSPRKMNNGQKKEIKNGKMAKVTNGIEKIGINRSGGEVVLVNAKDKLPKVEKQIIDVEKQSGMGETVVKHCQPTYAQMVGPITKPNVICPKPTVPDVIQENNNELSTDELKMLEASNNIQLEVKVSPKWQTVRPKGKKKHLQIVYDEQTDEWEDFLEDKPDEIIEIVQSKTDDSKVEEPIQNCISDKSMETPTPKAKPTKTEKAKLKTKMKKNQKKLKENNSKCSGIEVRFEENKPNGTSTPTKRSSLSIDPDIDNLLNDEGNEFLNNVDISNFNFETSPSMFVNAITNSGIYTDNAITGKTNTGFALNNSLKLLNKFDFCKMKENILLKEEEEMVIRVLKSLNQTDNQIVNVNKEQHVDPNCVKIVEAVAVNRICEDVKIEENIFENVNGDDDSHTMVDVNHETNGAENIVKCEANDEIDRMDKEMNEKDPLLKNGYHIEDHNSHATINDCCDTEPKAYCNIEQIKNLKSEIKYQLIEENEVTINSNGNHKEDTNSSNCTSAQQTTGEIESMDSPKSNSFEDNINDLDNTNVANNAETEKDEEDVNFTIKEQTNKDCTPNFRYDDDVDEAQSDLSELSDENVETVVSQSNEMLDYDELETIKDIDAIEEPIDDLQFDDEFVVPSIEEGYVNEENNITAREFDQNECVPQDLTMQIIQEISLETEQLSRPPINHIFIENQSDILKKEFTLNETQENKHQDRIQSPRNSEDSGILEYQDDGRYSSESDTDKPDLFSMQKFPLTEAISRWLEEKQKEKSPDPILRLPDDPELSQRIENSMKNRLHTSEFSDHDDDDDGDDDDLSSESETEFEVAHHSKNLIGNPLRVLFRKIDGSTNSNQTVHSGNVNNDDKTNDIETRKRVAHHNLDSDKASLTVDEPDILEFWENDPMLQSRNLNSNVLKPDQNSSIESDLEAYESVYGKTIDYAKLTADIHNDNVFLSNNILNNDNLSKLPNNPNNNNNDSSLLNHANSINRKDDTNSNNTNLNCFKPPEICCMLM